MLTFGSSIKSLWSQDRLRFFIIAYFFYVYSWMFRVALRTYMDGPEFRWVTLFNTQLLGEENRAYIAGNGMDGHFVLIQLLGMFFCLLLYLIIRRPDRLCKVVFLGWSSLFLIQQITVSIGLGTDYVMRADTLGLAIPFYIFGPAEQGVMVVLALLWLWQSDTKSLPTVELSDSRKRFILILGGSYLVSFALFRAGEHDGLTDKLGLLFLYSQTIALVFALSSFDTQALSSVGNSDSKRTAKES